MAGMHSKVAVPGNISLRDPLLATKLYIPQPRPNFVPRPRLTQRLNQGVTRKLTLISAPAGFGKTTLLGEWIPHNERRVAWLSLEEGDNDPTRFWAYFVAALRTLHTGLGDDALSLLYAQQPQPLPIESVLTVLVNEIAAFPDEFALVLDDYHAIESQAIHNALSFLLDHLPVNAHLVIATRAEPPLPLARLRIRGELTELRATDLRFTLEETAAFLNEMMGLGLSAKDVAALEARTEGWIASLQAAGLSMQGRDPERVSDFIQAFTGSHRYILDYLAEEVLHQQPESIQTFLMETAVLDRLTGESCNAVTSQDDGQAVLEGLEEANLFILPLDDRRRWYRYHHLFADFLRDRLDHVQGDRLPELHRRAARWYEGEGLIAEAVGHALVAGDFELAANLMERIAGNLFARGELATLLGWLNALPEVEVRARPRLGLTHVWALLFNGQLDAAESRLADVERVFAAGEKGSTAPSTFGEAEMPVLVEREEPALSQEMLGEAVAVRSLVACWRGEVSRAVELSRQALKYVPEGDLFLRGLMAVNIALNLADTYGSIADVEEASLALGEAARINQETGSVYAALPTLALLAELQVARGQLHQAAETLRQALHLEAERGKGPMLFTGVASISLGTVLYEWNDMDGAARYLKEGIDPEEGKDAAALSTGYISLARVSQAQGDIDGALSMIEKADQLARRSNMVWALSQVQAAKARLWQSPAGANLGAAAHWAQECGLDVGDEIGYRREGAYFTLARVLIALGREQPDGSHLRKALGLLEWLEEMTEGAGLAGSVIEILALKALALNAQGDTAQATSVLERALALAEPEGYIRLFVDEGAPMAALLSKILAQPRVVRDEGKRKGYQAASRDYVSKLLGAFGEGARLTAPVAQPLVESLTERELEVLRLIAAGLSNQEIAQELIITVGTVKRHVHNIYGKLGVQNRIQAAARANQLNLLLP